MVRKLSSLLGKSILLLGFSLCLVSCHKDEDPAELYFEDGEWVVVKDSGKSKPAVLVFLGDGYVRDDFGKENGKFISDVREGVRELFSVEPYKTYESYFKVYAIASYSSQRGMSYEGQKVVDTRFGVTKLDGTDLSCKDDVVFGYMEKIPGVKGKLDEVTAILLSNESVYAGICCMYLTGEAIAIVPVSREKSDTLYCDYGSILRHEAAGHGFGGCADEYVLHPGESIPEFGKFSVTSVYTYQAVDLWTNVSISDEVSSLPWGELVGLKGYEAVTNPEGGLYYSYGVWRSEESSCMRDNSPYFNAAQRLAIVRRIKKLAGEAFSLEEFVEKDVR